MTCKVVSYSFLYLLLGLLGLLSPSTQAQKYPDRPIKYIATDQPGSSIDNLARVIAEKLSSELNQAIIVENRPGAGGNIGADTAAKSTPDGYTLVQLATTHIANLYLYKNLPYNLQKDFIPITQLASSPSVLVVPSSLEIKSVADFIKYAKSKPEAIQYASAGTGTCTFLAAELFKKQAGVEMMHIPYKGGSPAMTSVLANETSAYFSPIGPSLQHIRAGTLRALAVSSNKRLALLPDVKTFTESGLSNYQFSCWYGLFLQSNTPKPIQEQIHKALMNVLGNPITQKLLIDQGFIPIGNKSEEFAHVIRNEIDLFKDFIKEIPNQ